MCLLIYNVFSGVWCGPWASRLTSDIIFEKMYIYLAWREFFKAWYIFQKISTTIYRSSELLHLSSYINYENFSISFWKQYDQILDF